MGKARTLAGILSGVTTAPLQQDSGSITSNFGTINTGSSTITTTGAITGGSFVIGSADINENDLESIDGITAGTGAASKALILDSSRNINNINTMNVTTLTASGTVSFGSLSDGVITATAFVDEDNMSSDSATLIPTQQSVKAYVDSQSSEMQFVLEDGDGTEVQITKDKEVKFVEGGGIDIDWTDTDNGTDGDPYDLTFTLNATQTGITSITNTSLVIGRDADNDIDFATDNNIIFRAEGADQVKIIDGAILPITDADVDLGSSSLQFKDAYFHGSLEADAISLNGTALGSIYSPIAGGTDIVTTGDLASGTIASGFGTISTGNTITTTAAITGGSLIADNITIDANTISSTNTNGDINITPNGEGKVNITSTSTTNTLQLTSALSSLVSAPDMVFDRNSSSPADNDYLGRIDFKGRNSASENVNYARLASQIGDATNGTEDGKFAIWNMKSGNETEALTTTSAIVKAPNTPMYYNHLYTQSASNSDDITFSSSYITDDYDFYDVVFSNVVPTTDDSWMGLRFGIGGTVHYGSTDYMYYFGHIIQRHTTDNSNSGGSSTTTAGNDADSSAIIIHKWSSNGIGSANGESYTARIRCYNLRSATTYPQTKIMEGVSRMASNYFSTIYFSNGVMRFKTGSDCRTDKIDTIRFFVYKGSTDTNTIASGSFSLFGGKFHFVA